MSEADDLIERFECETGQRVDDEHSLALAGLFGAVARLMGTNSHEERDDVAVGICLLDAMLQEGLSLDDIRDLTDS